MQQEPTYRIYVACLASYNNGRLHGEWFDLEDYADADDLYEAVRKEVLMTSPYPNVTVPCPDCEGEDEACPTCHGKGLVPSSEEWAIHDYEGFTGIGEYTPLPEVFGLYEKLEKFGEAYAAFLEAFGVSPEGASDRNFEAAYQGKYDSEADFAETYSLETGLISEDNPAICWIDWQRAWDSDLQHDFVFEEGYVFSRNW